MEQLNENRPKIFQWRFVAYALGLLAILLPLVFNGSIVGDWGWDSWREHWYQTRGPWVLLVFAVISAGIAAIVGVYSYRMNKENWWRPIICTAIIVLIPAVIVVASVFAIGLWRIF